jgi:hypothetical protein
VRKVFYIQCSLQNKTRIDVRWIPEKLAKEGKMLEVKDENGNKENGWVVKKTYGKISEENLIFIRDLHKHHRKATDI